MRCVSQTGAPTPRTGVGPNLEIGWLGAESAAQMTDPRRIRPVFEAAAADAVERNRCTPAAGMLEQSTTEQMLEGANVETPSPVCLTD